MAAEPLDGRDNSVEYMHVYDEGTTAYDTEAATIDEGAATRGEGSAVNGAQASDNSKPAHMAVSEAVE